MVINKDIRFIVIQKFIRILCFGLMFIGISSISYSQQPTTFTAIQNLDFGSFFSTGSGGSITVSNSGVRTAGGNVIPVTSSSYSAAIFRFYSGAFKVTLTSLSYSTSVTLTRAGGGGTMLLTLTPPNPSGGTSLNKWRSFDYTIGGTLTVGTITANPGGNYSGSFTVTVIYH